MSKNEQIRQPILLDLIGSSLCEGDSGREERQHLPRLRLGTESTLLLGDLGGSGSRLLLKEPGLDGVSKDSTEGLGTRVHAVLEDREGSSSGLRVRGGEGEVDVRESDVGSGKEEADEERLDLRSLSRARRQEERTEETHP